ncbi:MAG: DsbA family oxidoreductase [Pseudomonadota bacterium]
MSATLSIVSDFVCPWCYIGKARLDAARERLGDDVGLTIRFLPFKLNPSMPEDGMDRADYRVAKFGSLEKSNELDAQVRQAAEESGLTIHHDRMVRTPNTVKAHMLMAMAASLKTPDGDAGDVAERLAGLLFTAYFVDGQDIGESGVLRALGQKVGIPDAIIDGALEDATLRQATEKLADDLATQGISGVPSLLLDQHFLVSGAVPADDLVRILPQALAILEKAATENTGTQPNG